MRLLKNSKRPLKTKIRNNLQSCPMKHTFNLVSIYFVLGLLFMAISPSAVVAIEYQKCTLGQNCTIGEFLYDDSYSPYTGATCNITSRDPSEALYINNASMTEAVPADGWYSYIF